MIANSNKKDCKTIDSIVDDLAKKVIEKLKEKSGEVDDSIV